MIDYDKMNPDSENDKPFKNNEIRYINFESNIMVHVCWEINLMSRFSFIVEVPTWAWIKNVD